MAEYVQNFLSPVHFDLQINKLPATSWFVQRVGVPGLMIDMAMMPTPFRKVKRPGQNVEFQELTISFIVDENMLNYIELYNWMMQASGGENFSQYETLTESDEGVTSDATLIISQSNQSANMTIRLKDIFPINLSELQLDATVPDVIHAECTATFAVNSFDISAAT